MHTPTPWITEPHGDTTALYSGRDRDHHGLRLMNLDDGDMNFEANAAFIVRACNSHDELVAACKMLIHSIPDDWPMPLGYSEVVHQAVNAISKAEGK